MYSKVKEFIIYNFKVLLWHLKNLKDIKITDYKFKVQFTVERKLPLTVREKAIIAFNNPHPSSDNSPSHLLKVNRDKGPYTVIKGY